MVEHSIACVKVALAAWTSLARMLDTVNSILVDFEFLHRHKAGVAICTSAALDMCVVGAACNCLVFSFG